MMNIGWCTVSKVECWKSPPVKTTIICKRQQEKLHINLGKGHQEEERVNKQPPPKDV